MKFIIHTDGGARGNPGPAAIGVVIEKQDSKIARWQDRKEKTIEISKRIGETTNNVAEYRAVVEALNFLKTYHVSRITYHDSINFFLDSTLVVNQLNGNFKVKEPTLRELLINVRLLEGDIGGHITYQYVPREQNQRADFLVNRALDSE